MSRSRPPLGLYLHLPFCGGKCHYCDFVSGISPTPERVERYQAALLRELASWRAWLGDDPRPLGSIFFGGGTPGMLPAPLLVELLERISTLWRLAPGCEITLETNPDSCNQLAPVIAAGVNRVSLGVQAVTAERLHWLGRRHSPERTELALAAVRAAGCVNLNLDLIFGSPGHTAAQWRGELATVMAWRPEHLSCYCLSIEPGTRLQRELAAGRLPTPDPDLQAELWELTRETLATGGWEWYELSNYARPGRECRHNLNYWEFGDYLGVGQAAHGKLTTAAGEVLRSANPESWPGYLEAATQGKLPATALHPLSRAQTGAEFLLMGLRTRAGITWEDHHRTAGHDLRATRRRELERLHSAGLINPTATGVALTSAGVLLADTVISELL